MPLIGEILKSLVVQILSNQLTKQNINDKVDVISKEITHEFYKRDRIISILQGKLKELEDSLDKASFEAIDNLVKKIQDKTPFFVDSLVKDAGEVAKVELDKLTDSLSEVLVKLIEEGRDKLEEITGIDLSPDDGPSTIKDLEFHDDVDSSNKEEVQEVIEDKKQGISNKAKKLLKDLKEKHAEAEIPEDELGD